MALADRQAQRRAEAVRPYLEPDESIRASFLGQTPIPPWVFFLIAPYVFIFFQKYRTVVLTDRNVYSNWMTIDGGAKLHVPPFGPIKAGLTEMRAALPAAA